MSGILLGIDIGGTSTVATVVGLDGRRLGRGVAGPANPHTVDLSQVVTALRTAVTGALANRDRALVAAGLIGMAGSVAARRSPVSEAIDSVWNELGIDCPMTITGDAVVAFAAGSHRRSGQVVIAGTGAIAAQITDRRVTRTVDGLGWLLGDEGSGFWLARQAVRHAVRGLYAGRAPDALTARIIERFATADPDLLTAHCYRITPTELARLSIPVCELATAGDRRALKIVDEAAARLARTRSQLGEPRGPVVLAGGLLGEPTPVRAALLAQLNTAKIAPVHIGTDASVGAAWLAGVTSGLVPPNTAAQLHARLLT